MGYRNPELSNSLNLFPGSAEPTAWINERLHQRLRVGNGTPVCRPDQLDAVYNDLVDEPLLRLEYDRFLPEIPRHAAD